MPHARLPLGSCAGALYGRGCHMGGHVDWRCARRRVPPKVPIAVRAPPRTTISSVTHSSSLKLSGCAFRNCVNRFQPTGDAGQDCQRFRLKFPCVLHCRFAAAGRYRPWSGVSPWQNFPGRRMIEKPLKGGKSRWDETPHPVSEWSRFHCLLLRNSGHDRRLPGDRDIADRVDFHGDGAGQGPHPGPFGGALGQGADNIPARRDIR